MDKVKEVLDKIASVSPDWFTKMESGLIAYLVAVHLVNPKDAMIWAAVGFAVYAVLVAVDKVVNSGSK